MEVRGKTGFWWITEYSEYIWLKRVAEETIVKEQRSGKETKKKEKKKELKESDVGELSVFCQSCYK